MVTTQTDLTRWEYNCKDVIYTLEIAEVFENIRRTWPESRQDFFNFQQNEIAPALVDVMNRGVRVDLAKKAELAEKLTKVKADIEAKLNYLLGEPFNPKSTPQIKAVLGDLCGIKLIKDKKTKTESCSSQYMFEYLKQYPEFKALLTLILEYRSVSVFLKTFVLAEVDEDGRMRTAYNVAGTKTNRLSSRKNAFGHGCNLANIPSKGKIKLKYALEQLNDSIGVVDESEEEQIIIEDEVEEVEGLTALPNCKEFFIPDEGMMFFNADLSSADAMIVAADSDCKWLLNFFQNPPMKLYQYVASHYYQRDISTTDKEYKIFKQFIHGSHYGMQEAKAALNAGIPLIDAKKIRTWYFQLCKELPAWHKRIENEVKTRGYVENIFGARYYFFDRDAPTVMNQAIATIPQSTIAVLINKGLVNIQREEKGKVEVLLQVHDALAGQYSLDDLTAESRIVKHMSVELPYKDPMIIPVDISSSPISYGHCK